MADMADMADTELWETIYIKPPIGAESKDRKV
jgi:hypothetical protein